SKSMKNDYILDLVETFAKNLSNTLFDVKEEIDPIVINDLSDKEMLKLILKRMIFDKKFNEAEDFLFKYTKANFKEDIFDIGIYFYDELSKKSDSELISKNFSREEVIQGLTDFKLIYDIK
ncbi:MAG: DUF6483 family protein, partial [Sarcina sp.]